MTTATDIFSSFIELQKDGTIRVRTHSPGDWGEWTLAAFHADTNESVHSHVWERHPLGDELLCLLSGAVTVHLRNPIGDNGIKAMLRPGTCYVVPAGEWHRLTLEDPGDLVVVTPRIGTTHEVMSD